MAYSPNIIPLMTSDTAPSGVASGSNVYTTYAAWKAFDSDPLHTDYISNGNAPQWLQYQFPSPRVVAQYALRAPDRNNGNGAPTSFTLQGSNDGTNWVTLDTQTGLSWSASEKKTFQFSNTLSFTYYRLAISACKADGWCVCSEWELMESFSSGGDVTTDGAYTVHRFTTNGEFVTPEGVTEAEVLVIGGGGSLWSTGTAGTASHGGGAGATSAGNGTAGTENTGGGGGGAGSGRTGGKGAVGVVVIRHLNPAAANLTITSRHKVGFLAALHVTSRHKVRPLLFVRKTITSRHLVGYVYTPPPARLAVRSRHRVDAVQGLARLTLTSRHKVGELVRFTLDSMHVVKDVDPATLSLTSQHKVGFLAALHLTSKHKVGRRSHIVPGSEPPVEVYDNVDAFCQLNGIDLDLVELQLGGARNTYDTVRHYDGSVLIHDMRCDFYEHRMRIKLKGSSPSNLDTQEQAIQAACLAGGTFAWQSMGPGGVMGTLRTWTVAPSDAPDFERTKVSETLYRSYAPMVLRVWPA